MLTYNELMDAPYEFWCTHQVLGVLDETGNYIVIEVI